MKNFLKATVAGLLAAVARLVIHKYQPKIVMVTGSVGKTSTKDALVAVLAARFYLRGSEKSYNSEFGVPLTILGAANPWMNPLRWFSVFKEAFALLVLPNHYPKLLVLEVGADRPGDLAKILRIATPDAVVVTRLPSVPVHVEAYATPAAVREEEFYPAYHLLPAAPLILPADDEHALLLAKGVPAHPISYGYAPGADMRLSTPDFYTEEGRVLGMQAHVHWKEEQGTIIIRDSVGKQQLLAAAAALAAAVALDIPFSEALAALAAYAPPPGRGRVFAGKNGSTIIDDTYNASPAAVLEALATLKSFPNATRRVAVLGDMLELGRYSVVEHERVGKLAAESADVIVGVGIRAHAIVDAASAAGVPAAHIFSYDDSASAAIALAGLIQAGDVILIKGSQSIRTERITEALLADPADRAKLVRQEKEWKRKM